MRRDDGLAMASLSAAVLALHRGSRDWPPAQFQPRACEWLDSVVPFSACLWGSTAACCAADAPPGWHDLHTEGIDPSALPALLAGAALNDQGPPLRVVLLEPMAARRVELRLWRASAVGFGEEDSRALHFLLPHLVEAQRENRLARAAEATLPARRSLAVCSAEGELLQIDAQCLALMRAEWPGWTPPQLPPALRASLAAASLPPATAVPHVGRQVTVLMSRRADAVLLEVRRRAAVDRLSQRQRDIAERYVGGHSARQIAAELALSPSTVDNHLGMIFRKLGVSNKLALLDAMRAGGAASRA